ncbi:hypothetical protein BDR05DRAFT_945664 [Suillus weaverae]|nr:hypothetical protein BDR05DRAFT_945664 [Suillus weaverae]
MTIIINIKISHCIVMLWPSVMVTGDGIIVMNTQVISQLVGNSKTDIIIVVGCYDQMGCSALLGPPHSTQDKSKSKFQAVIAHQSWKSSVSYNLGQTILTLGATFQYHFKHGPISGPLKKRNLDCEIKGNGRYVNVHDYARVQRVMKECTMQDVHATVSSSGETKGYSSEVELDRVEVRGQEFNHEPNSKTRTICTAKRGL